MTEKIDVQTAFEIEISELRLKLISHLNFFEPPPELLTHGLFSNFTTRCRC